MMVLDHVAVLTPDIEQFCAENRLTSPEPIAVFADTGSRELYIDADHVGGRLLVMQPHGEGPYQRALAKRGPGLHHLGIATADLAAGLAAWTVRGWLVHPASGAAMDPAHGVFLYQRGVPTLIELVVGAIDLGAPVSRAVLAAGQGVLPAIAGVEGAAGATAIWHRGRPLRVC